MLIVPSQWIVPTGRSPFVGYMFFIVDPEYGIQAAEHSYHVSLKAINKALKTAFEGKYVKVPVKPKTIVVSTFYMKKNFIEIFNALKREMTRYGIEVSLGETPLAVKLWQESSLAIYKKFKHPYPPIPYLVGLSRQELKSFVNVASALWEKEFWSYFSPDKSIFVQINEIKGYLFPMGHDKTFYGLSYSPTSWDFTLSITPYEIGETHPEARIESFCYEEEEKKTLFHPLDYLLIKDFLGDSDFYPGFRNIDHRFHHHPLQIPLKYWIKLLQALNRALPARRKRLVPLQRLNRNFTLGSFKVRLLYPAQGNEHLSPGISLVKFYLGKKELQIETKRESELGELIFDRHWQEKLGIPETGPGHVYLFHNGIPVWHEESPLGLPIGDLENKDGLELGWGDVRIPMKVISYGVFYA